jgi:hypothetical protein
LPDDYELRVWNFNEDGTLWDVNELNGIDDAYYLWLDKVIQKPRQEHRVEWISSGEVLWSNDIHEAQYPARNGPPTQIWTADRLRWETPFMRKPDWWREKSDSERWNE